MMLNYLNIKQVYKSILFFFLFIYLAETNKAQVIFDKFILRQGIKIYEFKGTEYPDTLDICHGEWLEKGAPKSLDKISSHMINKIIRKAKRSNCKVVYLDLKNFNGARGVWPNRTYCLGLKTKD